jgi:predicted esterase
MRSQVLVLTAALSLAGCAEPSAQSASQDEVPALAQAAAGSNSCGANLLEDDGDTAKAGPWSVGQRVVKIGRLTTYVWYPAPAGSEAGATPIAYDPRDALPENDKRKIPVKESPTNMLSNPRSYRDLPIDGEHGPYPAVFFIHGTTSFGQASYSLMSHWASHGFIVVAADHPGLSLADNLRLGCLAPQSGPQDLHRDINEEIAALTTPTGDLAFLAGRVDMSRIGIGGHSQGAWTAATMTNRPNVQIVLPLATTTGTTPSPSLKSTFILSATTDTVIPYREGGFGIANLLSLGTDEGAYNRSPGPPSAKKRLVGVAGAGHLLMTDLCRRNAENQTSVAVLQEYGICGVTIQPGIFDCNTIDIDRGLTIVADATTAALEETLHCADRAERISALRTRYREVVDLREAK